MNNYIRKWEITGIVFVFLLGALLHFVFEWSGESVIVGVFASVNESVWEHFKQGFWPMCLFALIEYGFIRSHVNNFLAAKGVAIVFLPVITGLIFYTYTAFTGEEILIIDIITFAVAVALAQLISYKIMTSNKLPKFAGYTGLVAIILVGLILIAFTFFPPHWPILLDENTGIYGIP